MITHVKAKFDFTAQDESQLSFKKGDVIQVIKRLDCGWWDGVCNNERGWFPSNYVDEYEGEDKGQLYLKIDGQGKQYYVNSKGDEFSYDYPLNQTINDTLKTRSRESLPRNWGRKYTHDNKPYYYNKETDETCWSLDEINIETGELKRRKGSNTFPKMNDDISFSTSPKAGELTWEKLSNDIFYCLQQLYKSSRLNKKESYISHSSAIVETIRTMLYASNTGKRESPILSTHKNLKTHYKSIMNALSMLVVTTKAAAQVWPPPDAVVRMQLAAEEVHISVKKFILLAKELNLPLDSNLIEDSIYDTSKDGDKDDEGQQQNPSKIIAQLEEYSKTISDSTRKLNKTIRTQENISSEHIITETRNIVIDVGTFLSVIDEVDYDVLNEDVVVEFKLNRLAVCNSISGLVMATQNVVNPLRPSNFVEQIILSTELIEKAVKDFVISTKYLLQEKENMDQIQYQKLFSEYNRRSSGASSENSLINSSASSTPIYENNSTGGINYSSSVNSGPSVHSQSASMPRNRRAMSLSAVNGKEGSPEPEYPELDEVQLKNRSYSQRSLPSLAEGMNNMHINPQNIPPRKSSSHSVPPQIFYDPATMEIDQFSERKTSNAKLMKVLGTEVSNDFNAEKKEPVKKWYLEYDYNPKDLVFNMEGKVKGGTFEALVERLTSHENYDSSFTNTFLLTYRSFCTTTQFMAELIKRYSLPQPKKLTDLNDINEWHEKKLRPIRLRVCNVIKSWYETYYDEDDEDDKKAFLMAKEFFDKQIQIEPTNITVSKLLDKFDDKGHSKIIISNSNRDTPLPILPKSLRRIRFDELSPVEIARQLTLMCSKLYNQIQPVECLNKAWSNKETNSLAINIRMMIEMSNQVTGWVALTILQEMDTKKRASVVKRFIYIAEECYNLNNFNTLMSILAGFNSAPIHRLKRTWELINSKAMTTLENLKKIMDGNKNFSTYREQLHSVNPPCVPFLGVYLTDLTFIEDGNPNRLKNNEKLINFSKQSTTADVIREIQQYQNQAYCLQPVSEIQFFLKESLQNIEDDDDMYEMSLYIEPREREDEKITRLLFESGFL